MTEPAQSARWALPFLDVAQAQKEFIHNEALARLDMLLHPVVEAAGVNTPPTAPQMGQCWIVGDSPSGDWVGFARHLVCWTSGGWRHMAPQQGIAVFRRDENARIVFDGVGWTSGPVIVAPTGGTTVDTEARFAIAAILEFLSRAAPI